MTSQKEKTVVSLLNGPLSRSHGVKFKPELLHRMDSVVELSENAESF